MKVKGEEIRRRFPRIVMNLIMALIFWIISVFIPPTLSGLTRPGINTDASLLVWILMIVVMSIFLIRALSDALVLGDVLTDVLVKRLGIKEERSPKRAAREFVYIIIIVLVVTAVSPLLGTIQDVGYYLSTATVYIGLGWSPTHSRWTQLHWLRSGGGHRRMGIDDSHGPDPLRILLAGVLSRNGNPPLCTCVQSCGRWNQRHNGSQTQETMIAGDDRQW